MKKTAKSMLLLLPLVAGMLAGCNTDNPGASSGGDTPTSSEEEKSYIDIDISQKVTLNLAVGYQPKNGATNMKFITGYGALAKATSYQAANNKTYVAGDFKPVWEQLQTDVNFTIEDCTGQAASNVQGLYETLENYGFHYGSASGPLVNVLVGNGDQIVNSGNNGDIIDLADYLNYMPNFDQFLDENPAVKRIIMADPENNKGIYYAPYFDGNDDIERMLILRKDWVVDLLDGDLPTTLDTGKTIGTTYYTTFNGDNVDCTIDVVANDAVAQVSKKHTTSIITTQNALTNRNGANLVKALRDYIDTTYGGYYGSNRSELFVGSKAAYDIDELVALYRCVYTNPSFLTGDANKTIVPLYPRESGGNRYADFWRYLQFFGCRGVESRSGWFYVDDEGNLRDCRRDEQVIKAVKAMRTMYQEGLILQNFGDKTATVNGGGKYGADLQQTDAGFSTYDYVQTQTVYNDNDTCKKFNEGKYELVPTMPAAFAWDGGDDQYHYTESWRSVKSNGWCITSATTGEALLRCLYLFDYMYSEEGNKLMSYGPSAWVDGTTTYQGKSVPKLSAAALNELSSLAGGNYTNYYRYWLGGTFPIGYVKEQGMEWQCTSAKAAAALEDINACIEHETLKHVNHRTDNTDNMLNIIPATFAYTQAESNIVTGPDYENMSTVFGVQSSSTYNIWRTIITKGWEATGTDGTFANSYTANGYNLTESNYVNCVETTLLVSNLESIANRAYARMGMHP